MDQQVCVICGTLGG